MQRTRLVTVLALSIAGPCWAQATTVTYSTPISDRSDFLGDRISYDFGLEAAKVRLGVDGAAATPACIAAQTSLKGAGSVKSANGDVKLVFRVSADAPAKAADCGPKLERVTLGDAVLIDPKVLESLPPRRFGFTFGTLLVPYKYQFKGDKSLSGGASLGGYAGYREAFSGYSSRFVLFGGVTKVDVAKTGDGESAIESVAGLSYGVGWLGTLKDSFQLGVVLGADRVSKSAGYVNNGKPWLAVSLGFGFSN